MQNNLSPPGANGGQAVGGTRVGHLQPQDLAITILGAHLRRPGETVWSGGMVEILGTFGFTTEAARAALARLVLRGLLTRHKHGRLVHYMLTGRADELLAEGDRRIFSFGRAVPAQDAWTVLWHAIPEDRRVQRSRLARRLRFLGFGSIQDATWVAASDREKEVLALLGGLGVESFASVFTGRLSVSLTPRALLAQAWDLQTLGVLYDYFL
jgi:phenylacetic acid degradation operon negative regulatory protein